MGVSPVILVAYDVGYGERLQELQREVLILPMWNLYFECTLVQLQRKRRINTHSECYSLLLSLLESFHLSLKTYNSIRNKHYCMTLVSKQWICWARDYFCHTGTVQKLEFLITEARILSTLGYIYTAAWRRKVRMRT